MNPFLTILRLELRRLLRGRWLPALWLAFLALCAHAAWSGADWTDARRGALAAILEDERATHAMRRTQIVEQVTPDNHGRFGGALYATAMSLRATLPPGPLALLTVGQAEGYPMAATVFPFVPSNTIYDRHSAGLENPAVLAAGRFDLAFVLVWLLPLLVLAGSFDLFAGERERGMAPWLLSQPVSPGQLLAAKAAARAILLALPLTAILVTVVAVAVHADRGTASADSTSLQAPGSAPLLAPATAPAHLQGNTPRQVPGVAPLQAQGTAPRQTPGMTPLQARDGTAPPQALGRPSSQRVTGDAPTSSQRVTSDPASSLQRVTGDPASSLQQLPDGLSTQLAQASPAPIVAPLLGPLLSLGGLTLLYALFWLALALLVNLFARNAAQAALGCVAGWLVLVVLLPALALGVADLAAPPVSQAERVNVLRAKAMEARADIRAQAEAGVLPDRVPAPNIPDSLRRRALEVERGEQLIQQAVRPFDAQDARRHAWLDALRAVSPAIALQDALERLAGADAARALDFQRQAHAFLLDVRVLVGHYLAQDRLLTATDYDRGLPRFSFREASLPERAGILLADAALIGLAIAIALIAVRRRLRHVSLTD